MKVVWLATYPIYSLDSNIELVRQDLNFHPSSWIVNLSKALAEIEEIDLHIITQTVGVPCDQVVTVNNITFHILKNGIPFIHKGFPYYFPFDVLTGFYFDINRSVREIRKINPDIVHAHGTENHCALAGIKSKYPCIISMQGIVTEIYKVSPNFRFGIVKFLEQYQVKKGSYFACRTHFDASFISSYNKNAKISIINEAINPIYFENNWKLSNSGKSGKIIFVGSICKRKGVEVLLEAVSLVKRLFPKILLRLIGRGNGNYVEYLQNLCTQLEIDENVEFLGFKSAEEIAMYHLDSQIFVLASQNENSPNSLAEAMVSGLPVIATNVGGISSMVKNAETGLLISPDNPGKLAEKIIYLLNNPDERKRLGDNAKNVARKLYHPKDIARKTIEVYRKILG